MPFSRTALLFLSTLLTVSVASALAGSTTADPDAVEEDWRLVVSDPDPLQEGPQITTCMSPLADDLAPFVAFDMNYREYPGYQSGGMQVQVWSSGQVLGNSSQGSALFNTPGETVTWTQRMALNAGAVNYDINNGQSTTWGQFGQSNKLSVSFPTTAVTLAGYDPAKSVRSSGVSWESNHVQSLTLVQVRYYANGQLIWTDTNPKSVVSSN